MPNAANKHQQNSARTRERLIDAAVELYGSRSIDAVSLREISVAAGQKNPNALQYHFGDRNGLLQAIIDKHATRISEIRDDYLARAESGEWQSAEAAARCLAMPIVDYIELSADGLNFVRIISQITAVTQDGFATDNGMGITFPRPLSLARLYKAALEGIPPREAQRRIFLIVDICFQSIADIYRAHERLPPNNPVANKRAMIDQLLGMIVTFLAMPALN